MRDRINSLTLLATSLTIVVFSLLDLVGLLDGLTFFRARIPAMTLLAVGIALGYLALERRDKLDAIDTGLTGVSHTLGQIENKLQNPSLMGVEVFETTDALLNRLTEVTVGSETVSTLNLAPPRGTSHAMDNYFTQVHKYIKGRDTPITSFRTLATLESVAKARWVLERARDLAPTGRVSTSVISQSLLPPDTVTHIVLAVHIVSKVGQPYVFFYRAIDPSGVMDGFLIKNAEVARIAHSYFQWLWNRGVAVHVGRRIDQRGLAELLRVAPAISEDPNYQFLAEEAKRFH